MRISTSQFYESTAANYQKNFANVVKTSEEASSLVRVNTAADDPVGLRVCCNWVHRLRCWPSTKPTPTPSRPPWAPPKR